jgi:glycosyltransferase involved in cell wall biosynthesis
MILHIIDSLNRGGKEILLLDICRNRLDDNLCVVSLKGGELENDFKNSGIPYFRIQRRHYFDIFALIRLHNLIKERNIKVIHCHQGLDGIYANFACLFLNVKIVFSIHARPDSLKEKILTYLLKIRSDFIIYVSHSLYNELNKENFIKRTSNRSIVIPNGVDFSKIPEHFKKPDSLEISTLCMIANFTKAKDQLTVCRAFKILSRNFSGLKMIFVGSFAKENFPNYAKCLDYVRINQLTDRVVFSGKTPNPFETLMNCDIFILSSNFESFGIALIEAMGMGVPSIVCDIPSLVEITDNGTKAMVFQRGNPLDLAEKIQFLINHKNERNQMGESGKTFVHNKFNIQNHVCLLYDLYDKMITQ